MAARFITDTLRADARARVLLVATQEHAKNIRDNVSGDLHSRFHRAQGDDSRGKMFTHIYVADKKALEENEFVVRMLVRGFGVPVTMSAALAPAPEGDGSGPSSA